MLLPKSTCVCIPCFKIVTPRFHLAKYHFWISFGVWHEYRNGCGHIHVFKTFPRLYWLKIYIDSSVFAEIPFLAFLALHRERKRCGQVGPSPCNS